MARVSYKQQKLASCSSAGWKVQDEDAYTSQTATFCMYAGWAEERQWLSDKGTNPTSCLH